MESRDRLVVVWRVTERCNMGCRFCAYDRALERSRAQADEAEARRFGGVLAAWARGTGRRVLVSWLGGEPLLWPALEPVSEAYRVFGFGLSVTTNGLGLAQARWQAWAHEALDELTVSVDGPAPLHDEARDLPGSHAMILTALRALAERKRRSGHGPLLRVNTILMRQNLGAFDALCDALAGAGVEELTFNQLGGNDRPEFYPAHRLLPEQVDAFCEALPSRQARLAAAGLRIRGSGQYLARIRATSLGIAIPVDDCGPGRSFWFIDERGRIAPCSFTAAGYGVPLAELRGAEDLERLPARWAAMRSRERLAPCLDCHSTQVFDKFTQE